MSKATGSKDKDSAKRKAADYLLRALKQTEINDDVSVRHFVYLAEAELDGNTAGYPTSNS